MKQFAIFDMDGTLLDSMGAWRHLGSDYIKSRGINPPADLDESLRKKSLEQLHESRKDEAQWKLQDIPDEILASFTQNRMDNYFRNDKNTIENECHISKQQSGGL